MVCIVSSSKTALQNAFGIEMIKMIKKPYSSKSVVKLLIDLLILAFNISFLNNI